MLLGSNAIFSIIKECHLFSGVSEDDIELLLSIVKERSYRRGHLIFEEGEQASGFFIVSEGRVKLYKLSPDGKETYSAHCPARPELC